MNKIISAILVALAMSILFGCEKENPTQSTNPVAIQLPKTDCFKITVTGRGMVRVAYEDLAFAADISGLKTGEINLYRAGKAIPILVEDGGDGKIDKGDGIVFFCGQKNPRSRSDVFFLKHIKTPERPLRYSNDSAKTGENAGVSQRSIIRLPLRQGEAPEDIKQFGGSLTTPTREIQHGGQIVLNATIANRLFSSTKTASARLLLLLDRREEGVDQGMKHEIEVLVDGKVVPHKKNKKKMSQYRWKIACDVPLNLLPEKGLKTTEITVRNKTALSNQMRDAFVTATIGIEGGFLEVVTDAMAINRQAVLEKTADDVAAIKATGFSSREIRVFAPEEGKLLKNASIEKSGTGYAVVFATEGAKNFVAAQNDAYLAASVEPYEIETNHEIFLRRPDLCSPKNEADYLIIVPRDFMHAVKPLAELREKQMRDGKPLKVLTVAADDIYDQFGYGLFGPEPIRDFIAYTQKNWKRPPRYVLLAADANRDEDFVSPGRAIPCGLYRTYRSGLAGSDNYYGLPDRRGTPKIAVGRLPADNALELKTMVDKIVEYETAAQTGTWRRRIQIFAGTAGYGPDMDSMLEMMFDMIFGDMLPRRFDLEISYAGKNLAYYYPVEKFRQHMIDEIGAGALFTAYVGHGAVEALDRIYSGGKTYDLFESADAKKLTSAGHRTIMFLITCSSGAYDLNQKDCLAETLVKSAGGPVAVTAGSGETHPYANGVLGIEMLPAFFGQNGKCDALTVTPHLPIGDMLLALKRQSISGKGKLRFLLDLAAAQSMEIDRKGFVRLTKDHQYLYNLFGDPAMRPALPEDVVLTASENTARPGETLKISGECKNIPDGQATITLECDITKPLYPDYVFKDKSTKEYLERHRQANDKIVTSVETDIKEGKFTVYLKIPELIEKTQTAPVPGTYFIKVFAQSGKKCAIGATKIEIVR